MAEVSNQQTDAQEATVMLRVREEHDSRHAPSLPSLPTLPESNSSLAFGAQLDAVSFPGYEIVRELGRGGMGVVYQARHRKLNRLVALKMVLGRQYAGAEDRQRFRQEVEAVAKLNHPNIAQVYEVGEHDGFTFAAFEYIDGGTLQDWQAGTPLEPHTAARLTAAIARAVQHAHDHGIIHRDLKPANILLMRTDAANFSDLRTQKLHLLSASAGVQQTGTLLIPKVTDFGLAKRLDSESQLTATGIACGTPNYMAPEQIRGDRGQIGPSTDVYGLGAILFELLAGRPPFRSDSPLLTMQDVLDQPPPALKKLRSELPYDLAVIVSKCLEKDPRRRYASAAALADDLERFLDHRPILARGVGPMERAARWVRRNPWAAALIAALSVASFTMLALAVVLWRSVNYERSMRQQVEQLQFTAQVERRQAINAYLLAEDQRRQAEANAQAANEERRKAEAEASRAAAALGLATESIDTVLASFAADPRFQAGDFLDLRRDLLIQADRLYTALKAQTTDSTGDLEYRSLRVQYYLGLLWRTTGEIAKGFELIDSARRRFEVLIERFPDRPRWQIEYADMGLNYLECAQEDGELYRVNRPFFLESSARALSRAEELQSELRNAGQLALARAKVRWHLMQATISLHDQEPRTPEFAEIALTKALQLHADMPRDSVANDFLGRALLLQARALAQVKDPVASCYYTLAEEHYAHAMEVTFRSTRLTRWNCRYALARQAHGIYLDALGLHRQADDCFLVARQILERAVDTTPEAAPYRVDLAEAYLRIIEFSRRLQPKWDPKPMVDALDVRLAPFWNLGMPTCRARHLLARSKLIMAEWCAQQGMFQKASEYYVNAAQAWAHGFPPDQGGGYWFEHNKAIIRAAYMAALAGQADQARIHLSRIRPDGDFGNHGPSEWFLLACTWSSLAAQVPEQVRNYEAKALEALARADAANHFHNPAHRRELQEHPSLAAVRHKFKPQNIAPPQK